MKPLNLLKQGVLALGGAGCLALGTAEVSHAISFVTNPATGNQYGLTAPGLSWTTAQAVAVANGGNLVTINNLTEQNWLISTFGNSLFWIGLTDQDTEGVWQWISGEPVTYTNWAPGEPNQFGNEDYAVMNEGALGSWNDLPNLYASGIVEKPVAATAVPTPALLPGLMGMGLGILRKRRNLQAEQVEE
jgi:hypothetical protein